VTTAGFDGRARLASGSAPTSSVTTYRITVAGGTVRMGPDDRDGVVLDVPLSHVEARPLGKAGSVVLVVHGSPLLINFSDHEDIGDGVGAGARARRVVDAGIGRRRRDRFLRALERGRS
jgi:hypothetical protein